jgi:hypothetical protein
MEDGAKAPEGRGWRMGQGFRREGKGGQGSPIPTHVNEVFCKSTYPRRLRLSSAQVAKKKKEGQNLKDLKKGSFKKKGGGSKLEGREEMEFQKKKRRRRRVKT